MLDFPLMLWVKLPFVDRIQPQSNKFATGDPSAFSKTWLPPELRRVLFCKSLAVFLHFSLEEKVGPLLSALAGARKRETPTSNLTESTGRFLLNLRLSSATCKVIFNNMSVVFMAQCVIVVMCSPECSLGVLLAV